MGNFTVVSRDALDKLQLDAGVVLLNFNPANPVKPSNDDILAVTSGGINIVCKPNYSDLLEDVDNAPANTVEGMHIDSWDTSMGYTDIVFNAKNTKYALGAADIEERNGYKHIKPRRNVNVSDVHDLWWVGDKVNGGAFAIRLFNAISNDGINVQTTKNNKGQNTLNFVGHPTLDDQDTVPMEFYDIDASETAKHYVKQSLIDVTSSFDDDTVDDGDPLIVTLTPASGMEIESVSVLMGGVDITEIVYDAGTVSIASVKGNVVIMANAIPE
jgi:hypothetical protein